MNKGKLVTILSITTIFFLLFALVSCTSPSGGSTPVVITWEKTYGGKDYDEAYSIQQTSDGGYIVAGYTSSLGTRRDVYILKLDSEGNL
ncbi:MAG: Lipoprotein, putative [Thermotoga petrophila]|jgi:hypothetical protein|uniref:Lipoprotein, putative n=1 Tax=Thermotoga petrophila TaxID=93929 RepID=A0A101EQ41_9THEM|nr:MAG: Lipoprotein, putative [Thermotoga petrophila]